jgi:hypothetical protein
MPAKKNKKQSGGLDQATKVLAMQAILLAIIAGIVLYGVLKMVQLRDDVDNMIAQQLLTPAHQQIPKVTPKQ